MSEGLGRPQTSMESADAAAVDGSEGGDGAMRDAGDDRSRQAPPVAIADDHCLAGITDYAAPGPFEYEAIRTEEVNLWVPLVPEGCRVPVLHFATDRGLACERYLDVVEHLVSHGFLLACYESGLNGHGEHCMTAVQAAFDVYPDRLDRRVGAMGHGPGAQESFLCARAVERQWGDSMRIASYGAEPEVPVVPDVPGDWMAQLDQLGSPVFMFNGSEDVVVPLPWSMQTFESFDDEAEVIWYEAQGAAHMPPPARFINASAVPWFRWKLLGDREACRHFKALLDTDDWTLQQSQNTDDC